MTLLDPALTTLTPRLELHVPTALTRFRQLRAALPGTAVHYAVKANPHPVLLARAGRRRAAASTWPARPRCGPCLDAGARRGRPRLLQPGQAPRRRRRGGRARRPAVRRRLAGGDPQGRRGRARDGRAVPDRHLRRAARTGRCRASTAAPPPRPSRCSASPPGSGSTPPASPSTSAPSSATRRRGTRRSRPSARIFAAAARRPVCGPGCSTSAAASRPRSRAARPLSRRTAPRSGGRLRKRFGDAPPADDRRARPRRSSPTPATGHVRRRRGPPRRHPLGLPRRRGVHRAGRDPRRGDPLPARDRRRRTDRSVRARRPDLRQRRRALREAAGAAAAGARRGRPGRAHAPRAPTRRCYSTVGFNGFAPLPTELVLGLVPA